jgi:hypothetical protein
LFASSFDLKSKLTKEKPSAIISPGSRIYYISRKVNRKLTDILLFFYRVDGK